MAEGGSRDGWVWWTHWLNMGRQSGIASLSQFAKRRALYAHGIPASAICRLNTSMLQGANHRIKVIKRMA